MSMIILALLLVLTYDQLEYRHIDDFVNIFFSITSSMTNIAIHGILDTQFIN